MYESMQCTMNRRELVNHARHMAETVGAPERCAVDILARLDRLAHVLASEFEHANNVPSYAASEEHEKRCARHEDRCKAIECELKFFYGATVMWPGLYPVVECNDGYTIFCY